MDEFDNRLNNEAPGEEKTDGQTDSPYAATERSDDLSGASSGSGYSFHPDGTYSYSRPAEGGAAGGEAPRQPGGYGYHSPSPESSGQYTGDRSPSGVYGWQSGAERPSAERPASPGGYPYSGDPYPYRNARNGYAYQQENSGGKKKGSGGKIFGIITGALCLILIGTLIFVIAFGRDGDKKVSGSSDKSGIAEEEKKGNSNVDELVTEESPEAVGKKGGKDELTPKEIYRKVLESSVGILVYNKSDSLASEGTGVLFREDNDDKYTYIVTCAHVISGSNGTVMAQLHDEKQYKAEIVGFDTRTDIGVLRIEESGLKLAEIGDSSKLAVGDSIYAIGNPGGVEFANSFTGGMISALDRPVNSSSSGYTMECIQHTAAINPGNSGGALVNVFGQVVGINSMKIVDDEYEGMGFSVPSSVFVDIVNNIIVNGYVANRPKLGITYVAAQNYNSYGMFIALKDLPKGAIVIYSIADDSSLAGTEAQEGDMIVAVNGKNLEDSSYLPELIEKSSVGDTVTLSLIRINRDYTYKEFDVKVTLVEDRGDTVVEEKTTAPSQDRGDYFRDYFGDYFDDYFGDFFR